MRLLLVLSLMVLSLHSSAKSLTLTCSGNDGKVYIDLAKECLDCMEYFESPHPYPPFFDSAFVIKNSKDQFKLKGNQFIYEQIGTEHFFADLLNRRIMKCVEKGYTLYYVGKIERVGGIGGESTGMAIILGENYGRMMQVKGANLNSSSMLHKGIGQRVGVYGSFRTKIGVESGMYRIFLVDKVKLDP